MLQQIDVHQFWIKKMIDQKTLKDFLLYDKKTGVFTWKFTRKKALKNSMAVPVMSWLGERIQMVESMHQEVRKAA
jgi:ABC-type dipeptide/oligopeptide/nickel transport system permease component